MVVGPEDYDWLERCQPFLRVSADNSGVDGFLGVSAFYDAESNELRHGLRSEIGCHDTYMATYFSIEIHMSESELDFNGWPKIYEVGGRVQAVQNRYGISSADLHFNADGSACLTIRDFGEPDYSLSRFVENLVEPFFFRLGYVDLHGLAAARSHLWPEYSHGLCGLWQHLGFQIYRGLLEMENSRGEYER